jgi:hypothetical protein
MMTMMRKGKYDDDVNDVNDDDVNDDDDASGDQIVRSDGIEDDDTPVDETTSTANHERTRMQTVRAVMKRVGIVGAVSVLALYAIGLVVGSGEEDSKGSTSTPTPTGGARAVERERESLGGDDVVVATAMPTHARVEYVPQAKNRAPAPGASRER